MGVTNFWRRSRTFNKAYPPRDTERVLLLRAAPGLALHRIVSIWREGIKSDKSGTCYKGNMNQCLNSS